MDGRTARPASALLLFAAARNPLKPTARLFSNLTPASEQQQVPAGFVGRGTQGRPRKKRPLFTPNAPLDDEGANGARCCCATTRGMPTPPQKSTPSGALYCAPLPRREKGRGFRWFPGPHKSTDGRALHTDAAAISRIVDGFSRILRNRVRRPCSGVH